MRRPVTVMRWLGTGAGALLLGAPPGWLCAAESTVFDLTLEPGPALVPGDSPTQLFDLTREDPEPTSNQVLYDLTDDSAEPGGAGEYYDLTAPDGALNEVAGNFAPASPPTSTVQYLPSLPPTSSASVQDLPRRGRVLRVIDGDTYVIEGDFHVRLSSVNTPEKRERIGPAVGDAVRKLLLHKEVTLSYGATPRDGYGRLIADVQMDGQSVAEILVRQGLAHIFIIPPTFPQNYEALVKAQREARAAGRGIWAEQHYRGPLHITSFHANARGDDRENLAGEYLRIANTSGTDLNLAGFTLTNESGKVLTFPGLVVPDGFAFQVFSGRGEAQGGRDIPYKVFWNSEGPIWNNDDDCATLKDPDGKWVDEATHAPRRAHPKAAYM